MEKLTVASYLLRRLKEAGCDEIFGVPGDFVLGFFNEILKSDIRYIGTCNELNAAYAADSYARIKGIGALATTYTVGELSAINGIAGSYAESVPVVQITGVPATRFYRNQPLLHHTLGDYQTPFKMYCHVTVAQTILDNIETATSEIDRVITACLRRKAPVYIGIPSDMVPKIIDAPLSLFIKPPEPKSDPGALDEAILETLNLLHHARRPIFIPGIDIIRHSLREEFRELLAASGIPFSTMMLSKCILDETHPQFIGLYAGDRSRKYVRDRVENSDCLMILGEKLTDFNTGGFSARMDWRSTIEVFYDAVRVMFHVYNNVYIHDFLRALAHKISSRPSVMLDIVKATDGCVHRSIVPYTPVPENELKMNRVFHRMAHFLKKGSIVIAETGAALFSAAEVLMPQGTMFIGQTFYGSIGYTVGACLGACIAAPHRKVYLFIGDGSFQVTCQDLSTMIRYGCKPVVFLVNNDGYTIERVIVDRIYNDIQPWKYRQIVETFGGTGKVFDVKTEADLEHSLEEADQPENADKLIFIELHLDRFDCNDALKRAGAAMAMNNRLLDDDDDKKEAKKILASLKSADSDSFNVMPNMSDE